MQKENKTDDSQMAQADLGDQQVYKAKIKFTILSSLGVFLCYFFTMAFMVGLCGGVEKAHFGSTLNAALYVVFLPFFFEFGDFKSFKAKYLFLGILAVIATAFSWYGIQQALGIDQLQDVAERIKAIEGSERIIAFVGTALFVPAIEEMLFRRGLFVSLKEKMPLWGALVLSSVVFAAVHFSLLYFIPLAVLGFIFAYFYEKSKSLWVPILLHAFNNGLTLIDLWWDLF